MGCGNSGDTTGTVKTIKAFYKCKHGYTCLDDFVDL